MNVFLGGCHQRGRQNDRGTVDFLENGRKYQARIYADGEDTDWETNPVAYRLEERIVTSQDTLKISMANGGGQAVSFLPF